MVTARVQGGAAAVGDDAEEAAAERRAPRRSQVILMRLQRTRLRAIEITMVDVGHWLGKTMGNHRKTIGKWWFNGIYLDNLVGGDWNMAG